MSEDRFTAIESQLVILKNLVAIGWALLVGAFCIGAWTTLLEIRVQSASAEIERLTTTTDTIRTWHHETNGNRYTSTDHVKFANEIMAVNSTSDKRITRLEDSTAEIKKSLDRIENKLQTK